ACRASKAPPAPPPLGRPAGSPSPPSAALPPANARARTWCPSAAPSASSVPVAGRLHSLHTLSMVATATSPGSRSLPPPGPASGCYSLHEAARLSRIPVSTFRRWVSRGIVPPSTTGLDDGGQPQPSFALADVV